MTNEANKDHERRSFHRIMFDAVCTLHQGEDHWESQILDISLKGVLIQRPENFTGNTDENFESVINLSDDGISIVMSLRLAHEQGDQLGFHCDYIDIDSITHLRRLVELNLGDADMLDREITALSTEALQRHQGSA